MIKSNRRYLFGMGIVGTIHHGTIECSVSTAPEGLFKGFSTVVGVKDAVHGKNLVVAKAILNPALNKSVRTQTHVLAVEHINALVEGGASVLAAANDAFSMAKEKNCVVDFVLAQEPMPLADALSFLMQDSQNQLEEDGAKLKALVGKIAAEVGSLVIHQTKSKGTYLHPALMKELQKPGNERLLEIAKHW